MPYAVDLHIHTALSPCADDDMTPNNIVNMSLIKGLDAIAITDHNSCLNVEAVIKAAEGRLLVIPGMEVQTREEVHILCYFESMSQLLSLQRIIDDRLPSAKNVPELFGHQLIIDEEDRIIGEKDELLLTSVNISLDELVYHVKEIGGAAVPAHIDRASHGILSVLGFIPDNPGFKLTEISQANAHKYFNNYRYKCIISSDAHFLGDILERIMLIDVEKLKIINIISYLKDPYKARSYLNINNTY